MKTFLFGWEEKWKDKKCNLYQFIVMSLLDWKKKVTNYIFIKK